MAQRWIFEVDGVPIPQGSMKHIGQGRIVSKSAKLKHWREHIARVVDDRGLADLQLTDAVLVRVIFSMPRPASVKRKHHTVPPDLDKLQRAIGDALSIDCRFMVNDSQIVEWQAKKVYGQPGCLIEVVTIS